MEKEDPELHNLARLLLSEIFKKHDKYPLQNIDSIEIKRQYENIDIILIINGNTVILIEDKINSREHSDQLSRYLSIIEEEDFSLILPIYLQTGQQSSYKNVEESGFVPFLRNELLSVLKTAGTSNNILQDYISYLERIEEEIQSFRTLPLNSWHWYSWQGFYSELQILLEEGDWEYIPNQRGGFLGFNWHWYEDRNSKQYLQLEEEKLCFKIGVRQNNKRKNLREEWHRKIMASAKHRHFKIVKPSRFGSGKWMTVAKLESDYRQSDEDGFLDIQATLRVFKEAMRTLKGAARNS